MPLCLIDCSSRSLLFWKDDRYRCWFRRWSFKHCPNLRRLCNPSCNSKNRSCWKAHHWVLPPVVERQGLFIHYSCWYWSCERHQRKAMLHRWKELWSRVEEVPRQHKQRQNLRPSRRKNNSCWTWKVHVSWDPLLTKPCIVWVGRYPQICLWFSHEMWRWCS